MDFRFYNQFVRNGSIHMSHVFLCSPQCQASIQNALAHAQKETCKGKVPLGMWPEVFEFQQSNINVEQKLD